MSPVAAPRSVFVGLLVIAIRAYQYAISPFLGSACRFAPSCSEYAIEALHRHGPIHGFWIGVRRVARCHPFHPGGLDPVP